jgi:histidine ammonia-lyase
MNSATDNPLVFAAGGIVSGGNFHGAPVGLVLDYAAIAATDLASIAGGASKAHESGVLGAPRFSRRGGRIELGLMLAPGHRRGSGLGVQDPLASRLGRLDPTSADKEDHVSMSPIAARVCAGSSSLGGSSRSSS